MRRMTFTLFPSIRLLVIVAPGLGLVGCGVPPDAQTSVSADTAELAIGAAERSEVVDLSTATDADWEMLFEAELGITRLGGESLHAYRMRKAEQAVRQFRELGLAFWNDYPDDPRRYSWLVMSVNMPPAYPEDVAAWARGEEVPEPNIYEKDVASITQWDAIYPSLRETFWTSTDVSDRQRRLLWFGEIINQIDALSYEYAAGNDVNTQPVLTEFLKFLSAFPEPFDEMDTYAHRKSFKMLWNEIIYSYPTLFGWNTTSALQFSEEVVETGNLSADQTLNGWHIDPLTQEHVNVPYGAFDEQVLQWMWNRSAYARLPSDSDRPYGTMEGEIVRWFYEDKLRQKFRLYGCGFLPEAPFAEKLHFVMSSFENDPLYFEHPLGDARRMAVGGFKTIRRDAASFRESVAQMQPLFEEVIRSGKTSLDERFYIRIGPVWRDLWDIQRPQRRQEDSGVVRQLLEDIRNLHSRYEELYFESETELPASSSSPIRRMRSLIRIIVRDRVDYGLSIAEVRDFLEPFRSSKDENVSSIVGQYENLLELIDTPFEFRGQTLDRTLFDLADLRGKIVLVDHWSTGCASCIGAMPRIHDVYLEYKDRGFEVVSLGYDATRARNRVLRIKDELGLSWVTVDAEEQRTEMFERFGWGGFPQYFLLNRDGTLYADTTEVANGRNLKPLLDAMLKAEEDG